MLNQLALDISRHLLTPARWARARLAEHAGKRLRVNLPLGTLMLQIAPDGYLESASAEAAADLTITVTPLAAASWMNDRRSGWRAARIDGDTDLAAAVSYVATNLHWDYEEDLSQLVGDVAAHRIGRGVRHLSAWPAEAASALAHGVAEYLSEERQTLATPLRVEEFTSEVDELRDAVERLEKRLEKLARAVAESSPH